MKVQEVILQVYAGKLKWWEAAGIIGVSDRTMRRWRDQYERLGYDGLFHRQRGQPSPKRVPVATVEKVLAPIELSRKDRRTACRPSPRRCYSDRGGHFFYTPKAGEAVDKGRLTPVGRALRELYQEQYFDFNVGHLREVAHGRPCRWHVAVLPKCCRILCGKTNLEAVAATQQRWWFSTTHAGGVIGVNHY